MQDETAEVIRVDKGYAFIKTNKKTACGECSSKASCGSVKLFSPVRNTQNMLKVKVTTAVEPGDIVHLNLAPSVLIQGTILVYIIPLISLFVFAIIGKLWWGESASILIGLGGFFVSLIIIKRVISKSKVTKHFTPELIIND